MYQATTKFMGSVIWTGTREECLLAAKRVGIPRSEFRLSKIA